LLNLIEFVCRKHVVFGRVVDGKDVVTLIENQEVDGQNKPKTDVIISNCGELVFLTSKKKGKTVSCVEVVTDHFIGLFQKMILRRENE
jgi:hypothetical protein